MKRILRNVKPTPEEERELQGVAKAILELVDERVKREDVRISPRLVGSVSRGTWLKLEQDIDIFLLFPVEYEKARMEKIVTKIGWEILKKPIKRYAEHPYVKGWFSGYEVEIVPCYAVKDASAIMSAVDRTPFHEEFVKENIDDREDEVRLLKQFLKGIGCYGAEAKTEGVSGYLAELLVIKYGSFDEVLERAAKWTGSEVVQMRSDFLEKELREKFRAPLVVIDPVDSERNVASALSLDNFSLFVHAAKEYLKKPRERFFFPRQRAVKPRELIAKFRKRKTSLIAVVFPKPDVVEDVLYPQMRKAQAAIAKLLKSLDFDLVDSSFFVRQKACILIELKSMTIPNIRLHQGPPVNSKHEVRFLKKHIKNGSRISEPFIRGDKWYVYLRREYTDASDFLKDFIRLGRLAKRGIASHVAKSLEGQGVEIRLNNEAISKEFAVDILEYFEPMFPWRR